MRIALVASQIAAIREPQVGGAQVVVADLARGLAERGHEVALFAPAGSAVDGVTVVDTGVDPAALAESRHRPLAENAPPPVVSDAFRRVFGAVAEGGWDCVHNHAFDAPAIDAARALRRPVVHTLHLPPERHVAAALALARSGDATAPLLVAVSDASARSWQERVPVDAIVRNGVPTRRIPWSAKGGPALLFAGRLSPEKGADIAIEIARRTETPLTIVGAAYDAAWAQQLVDGVDSRLVHVVGALPRTAVWTLMAGAAALLAPSRWEEPFGLTVAEAQAAGTPVVVWRRGALPELVLDGETGTVVDTVDEAVEAVGRVRALDRVACRRHAERSLDADAMVEGYERLYERATRGREAVSPRWQPRTG